MKEPYHHAILPCGKVIIGLHQTTYFNYPAITYLGIDTPMRIQQLKDNGLKNFSEVAGKSNLDLKTWEG
ncbi:MAG: hypothetical protein V4722_02325 [Bacteroidota bacterium]